MNNDELTTHEGQQAFVSDALSRSEELRRKKEYKEGISLLVEALQYGIEKAMIYYRLGNLYIDGGDLNRAEYAYKRALELDPHHVNSMHNLAVVYKRQKKMSLYVKTYKKSQRMEFRHPRRAKLDEKQKGRVRRIGFKAIIWTIGILGGVALLLFILLN